LYAYGQTILAYKVYLDSRDDTELLREIRDLLKQRS
jgi:large-conductance mechanosensitive channel